MHTTLFAVGVLAVGMLEGPVVAPTSSRCSDLIGRWEYVVPPSPLPGTVEVVKEDDLADTYRGAWWRPGEEAAAPAAVWKSDCKRPESRWWALFGTRPAPSCKGEIREHVAARGIDFMCHMPDGTATLVGAVRRLR